tara:strand:- start:15 stop:788 length:774 start_codon:yes stop_codon:yes gene_type:complete
MTIKFFGKNVLNDQTEVTFSTSFTAKKQFLYDGDLNTSVISQGSDDTTSETFEFDFNTDQSFDYISISSNMKAYTIQYWNGSTYVDFSTLISESKGTDGPYHDLHTFNKVSSQKIKIIGSTTSTVNAEKQIFQLRVFLHKYTIPTVDGANKIKTEFTNQMSKIENAQGGVSVLRYGNPKLTATIDFNSISIATMDFFESLETNHDPLHVLLDGSQNERAFRPKDLYEVEMVNEKTVPQLVADFFDNNQKFKIKLQQR